MLGEFEAENITDENGNPSGGSVVGIGMSIEWQNGPLGRDEKRIDPNGAFVETVLAAGKQRLEYYQEESDGKFACSHNQVAIHHIGEALRALNERTKEREVRGVEGTHEV